MRGWTKRDRKILQKVAAAHVRRGGRVGYRHPQARRKAREARRAAA